MVAKLTARSGAAEGAVEVRAALRQFARERAGGHAPAPVAVRGTWCIHARLRAESEQILQRQYRQQSHRAERGADECLGHGAVGHAQIEVTARARGAIE